MIKSILIAIFFGITTYSSAQVATFGRPDCGQWFSMKTTSSQWLLGFLSGLNSGLASPKKDYLNSLNSADQAILWMDNYCRNNPLSSVQIGANTLFEELMKKTK